MKINQSQHGVSGVGVASGFVLTLFIILLLDTVHYISNTRFFFSGVLPSHSIKIQDVIVCLCV